jgi:hypothetical protein
MHLWARRRGATAEEGIEPVVEALPRAISRGSLRGDLPVRTISRLLRCGGIFGFLDSR